LGQTSADLPVESLDIYLGSFQESYYSTYAAGRARPAKDNRERDAGFLPEDCLDFSGFYPFAMHLDLVVDSTKEFQGFPRDRSAYEIPCSIKYFSVPRHSNESGMGLFWVLKVSSGQLGTRSYQLARGAGGDFPEVFVDNQELGSGKCFAYGDKTPLTLPRCS
jgi:hypothetical protein